MNLTLRASQADRIFACPGSMLASEYVQRTESSDGDEGTQIHYEIAKLAVDTLGALADPPLAPPCRRVKLPTFSSWIPAWAIERIRELVPADWSLMVEVPLAYEYALPRPQPDCTAITFSGHLDVLAISPDGTEAVGIDWKTGQVGADPAESNWQAAVYMGLAKKAWPGLSKIKFVLAQPRIDEESAGIPRISETTLEGDALERLNSVLADKACTALENRYETDSGPKQCRWCPLANSQKACLCPSLQAEQAFMKSRLTPETLAALAQSPDDGLIGDFVLAGRTLAAPLKEVTELLHARIDAQGYVDSASGHRITRKVTKGDIEIPDKVAFRKAVEEVLPERERQDQCMSWSKGAVIEQIAEARGIPKESKKEASASGIWKDRLEGLVVQNERRVLVVT
jgi:hypothetical protein